jgi:2-iminobutanoate/2-iminopropanoate deaminase
MIRPAWLLAVLLSACAPAAPQFFPFAPRPELPFSEAVRVGRLLYVSGQVGSDSGAAGVVAGGIGPETARALENLEAVLTRHGSSMDQVVKCTALLADMREWNAMNKVYATYFKHHFPSRTALGGVQLVFGARVEFDCIAHVS